MARALPTVSLNKREWFIDARLQEIRDVKRPWVIWRFADMPDVIYACVQRANENEKRYCPKCGTLYAIHNGDGSCVSDD